MSVSLPDVNVLIALFDEGHLHHDAAHGWYRTARRKRWATCPVTESGFIRVLANPAYSGMQLNVADLADALADLTSEATHEYWGAAPSLTDRARFRLKELAGHRQLTDVLLLGLAVEHGGALVTLDRSIPLAAVVGATKAHLQLLG